MVSGKPSCRGDFNPVTAPDRFHTTNAERLNRKDTRPEIQVFDNISPGTTTNSDVYPVGACVGFSVHKKGTGNVLVQVSPEPQAGTWFTVDTMSSNPDSYDTVSPHSFVRIQCPSGASGVSVWLYRKYAAY